MHDLDVLSINIPEEIRQKLLLISNINIKSYIEKGNNGYIFFAHNNIINHDIVLKFYYWAGDPRQHKEPQLLKSIDSDNVIKIHHADMVDDEWAFFITDHCPGGDLDSEISKGRHGIFESVDITRQVLNGLSSLHANRLIHQDLKPANIFIHQQGKIVIGDFGSVKYMPDGQTSITPSAHSVLYTPPESININQFGTHGDLYQVGIVLFQLLGGYLPYKDTEWLNKHQLIEYENASNDYDKSKIVDTAIHSLITRGKLIDLRTLPAHINPLIKKIIRTATHIDPRKRYTSCSIFMNELTKAQRNSQNWYFNENFICLDSKTCYRISTDKAHSPTVEKRKTGHWKRDHSFSGGIDEIIAAIEINVSSK